MKCSVVLVCVLAAVLGKCQTSATPPANGLELEGVWQGALGEGASKLRLVLTITRTSDGVYNGIVDSLDQGASIPADQVTLQDNKVRLEFQKVGGTYEGVLSKDGDEAQLTGTWTQSGIAQPLNFRKAKTADTSETKPRAGPPPARPIDAPIDVIVPLAPTAFGADGKINLVYELHITNFARRTLALSRIEVVSDGKNSNSLARYEGADLAGRLGRPGVPDLTGMEKLRIGAGLRAIAYIWLMLDSPQMTPSSLEHRVVFKLEDDPEEFSLSCARILVSRDLAVIAAPLRGGGWRAVNGPSNTSTHRRASGPFGGQAHIAQRFAIDWVRITSNEKTYSGDPLNNKNYSAYGAEVFAVAEGTVTEAKDGIPENVPGLRSRAVGITLDTVAGNHIVMDIGHGRYAVYGHMQPGSLRVKVGDQVKRGQVLGLIGNTGNSTEPHLHFHLCDANSALACEGLPYALESFDLQLKPNAPTTKHHMEMPTENEIVKF